jgi:hypothetical protein
MEILRVISRDSVEEYEKRNQRETKEKLHMTLNMCASEGSWKIYKHVIETAPKKLRKFLKKSSEERLKELYPKEKEYCSCEGGGVYSEKKIS